MASTGWQTDSVPDAVKFLYADRHVQHPQGAWNGRPYIDKTDPGCAPGTAGGYYRASGDLLGLRRAYRASRNARFRSRLTRGVRMHAASPRPSLRQRDPHSMADTLSTRNGLITRNSRAPGLHPCGPENTPRCFACVQHSYGHELLR